MPAAAAVATVAAAAADVSPTAVASPSPLKRPRTGLGSLVATLTGKGKKASVLDKSKEDWDKFKETDGKEFVHDMEQAKKDGYLGRVEFLARADVKQFERERDLRAKRRNPLLKRTDE